MFYFDNSNILNDQLWTAATGKWDQGALGHQSYVADPNSSLTATFNQCALCANTILLAYTNQNGTIRVGNLTTTGWQTSSLGIASTKGSDLGITPFYRAGVKDEFKLYYQRASDENLVLAAWTPATNNNGGKFALFACDSFEPD